MFPISDVIPSRTTPVVTMALIALNVLLFMYQVWLDDDAVRGLVLEYGVVPATLAVPDLVTSLFLHGDGIHLVLNMLFLWIFGDNVEDRLGHGRYLGFYLAAGVIGALAQVAAAPASRVPMIGASGAVAGVMGAYFLLYPRSRVLTAVFLLVFLDVIEIPAIFFLGVWFLLQVVYGATSSAQGSTAFWAHAAGFASGALVGAWLRTRERAWRDYWRGVGS
ncbi:MAG TPA: rhomboid family intramembrane serine protease [Vicinamibacterales bacterium]|nr:rhomboid family intramembrane serine protease [Vicinamibacterales bacterium]